MRFALGSVESVASRCRLISARDSSLFVVSIDEVPLAVPVVVAVADGVSLAVSLKDAFSNNPGILRMR